MKILAILLFMMHLSQQPIVIIEVYEDGFEMGFDKNRTTEDEALFEAYKFIKTALLRKGYLKQDNSLLNKKI